MIKASGARSQWLVVGVLSISIIVAFVFFLSGGQQLYWDAANYYQLGERLGREGLGNFHDLTRTFGYPLFIAIIWLLSDHFPSTVRFLIFIIQLLLFLITCLFAYRVFGRLSQRIGLSLSLFCVLALNPFLLIYTGVVLSDLLSAVSIFLAVLLAVQVSSPATTASRHAGLRKILAYDNVYAVLSFFIAGCAVMIRPANSTIVLAVLALWLYRRLVWKEGSVKLLPLMILVFFIPFIPQVINNWKAYNQFQPLIVRSLFEDQLKWGMQYFKYATAVLPNDVQASPAIFYRNPFQPPNALDLKDFLLQHPVEFVTTQGIHLFAMFDHDYAFPYIKVLNAWYRLPLAILNDVFLFGAAIGILKWLPRSVFPFSWSRMDLALAGMLLATFVYLPVYIFVAVEPRFSLPVYLLLSPFFVHALAQTQTWLTQKLHKPLVFRLLGLVFFVLVNLALSRWLWSQAPLLVAMEKNAGAVSRYSMYDIPARFGDRIQLKSYGLEQAIQPQAGNTLHLALKWQCNGASTEPYQLEIALLDASDRTWSTGEPDYQDIVSPCRGWFWNSDDQVTDYVSLRLPITMPAGTYRAILGFYDPSHSHYVPIYTSSAATSVDHLQVTALSIAKNKSSVTQSDLNIENRYFVDMQEMRLLGYSESPGKVSPGSEFEIGLYWRARAKPRGDYVVVTQLRDSLDRVTLEQSARPADGTYPTTLWDAGEVLLDWHNIKVPDGIPEGEYGFVTVLRDAESGQTVGQARLFQILVAP